MINERMKSITLESLHYALSMFNDESQAAVIYMLEKDHGIKLFDSAGTLPVNSVVRGLESIFGTGTSILLRRIEEYNRQSSVNNNCCLKEMGVIQKVPAN